MSIGDNPMVYMSSEAIYRCSSFTLSEKALRANSPPKQGVPRVTNLSALGVGVLRGCFSEDTAGPISSPYLPRGIVPSTAPEIHI